MKSVFATAISALTVVACASGPKSAAPTNTRITVVTDTHIMKTSDVDLHEDIVVDAPRTAVLNALKDAYADLGIEMKFSNPATGELGNLNFVKMHSIGGKPMSHFLNCGHTPTGLAADDYRITMTMLSMVLPEGPSFRVQTRLQARASDFGVSTSPRDCQSLGGLEATLHRLVKTKLAM